MSDGLLDAAREIERLSEKATPRPWHHNATPRNGARAIWNTRGDESEVDDGLMICVCPIGTSSPPKETVDANMRFIVAACNHAPALARALVEQDKRIKELEAKAAPAPTPRTYERGVRDAMEAALKVTDEYTDKKWAEYKKGHGPNRADPYTEGQSDGAEQVGEKISVALSSLLGEKGADARD